MDNKLLPEVEKKIITLRNQQVILDSDIALRMEFRTHFPIGTDPRGQDHLFARQNLGLFRCG